MFAINDLADFLDIPVENLPEVRVRVLSGKAKALILQHAPGLGDDTAVWPGEVRDLALSVVARAIEQAGNAGVDSVAVTAGPFSQTRNYNSDSGTVWLTKQEKAMLRGHGGSKAYGIDLMPDRAVGGRRWLTPTWWEPTSE